MKPLLRKIFPVVLLIWLISGTANAGGIILYEVASSDVALATAGYAARAQDAATLFTNPAGMTKLEGTQFKVGTQALYIDSRFKADSNTTNTGGNGGNSGGFVPAGALFLTHKINDDWSMGIGTLSYFGLGLEYDSNWAGRYFVQEAELIGLTFMPSVAYRVDDKLSIGLSLNIMHGQFNTKSAINNNPLGIGSAPDGQLKIDTEEWGLGANLGILYDLKEGTRFGLTYLSKVDLDFEDTPEFNGLSPGMEIILGGLGILDAKLDLGMTVPQTLMFSSYHELDDRWAIMGNLGWHDWSEFGKMNVTITSEDSNDITVDRKYDDTWHIAFGGQYKLSDAWRISSGIAYDSSMVKDRHRTPDMAVGDAWRLGMGGNYQWLENLELGLGYTLIWIGDMSMDHSSALGGRLSGKYEDVQIHAWTANLSWVF